MASESKCPFTGHAYTGRSNRDWWPNQPDLKPLQRNPRTRNPMGEGFDCAKEFKTLDQVRRASSTS